MDNYSIDLISSLPTMGLEKWLKTLHTAGGFRPPHISVYDLQVEERTAFGRWYSPGALHLQTMFISIHPFLIMLEAHIIWISWCCLLYSFNLYLFFFMCMLCYVLQLSRSISAADRGSFRWNVSTGRTSSNPWIWYVVPLHPLGMCYQTRWLNTYNICRLWALWSV